MCTCTWTIVVLFGLVGFQVFQVLMFSSRRAGPAIKSKTQGLQDGVGDL